MGQTIAGGYYRGPSGKYHDANGQPVEVRSEPTLKKAREVEVEIEGAASATDPGPLGPLVPVPDPETPAAAKGSTSVKGSRRKSAKKAKKAKEPKKAKKAGHEPSSLTF